MFAMDVEVNYVGFSRSFHSTDRQAFFSNILWYRCFINYFFISYIEMTSLEAHLHTYTLI